MLKVFFIAATLRVLLMIYGYFHDELVEVKYTDIDYSVFTEASHHIYNGTSPYLKDTYKYTPILAYLLLPNIYVNIYYGKILFCCFDLLVAYIQMQILKPYVDNYNVNIIIIVSIFWLFNPFTMTISSRGNAESIQLFLVMAMFYYVMRKQIILAGIFFGLAVHFKLYPVIYGVPLLLHILAPSDGSRLNFRSFVNNFSLKLKELLLFGLSSVGMFFITGFIMYYMYGDEFLQSTYLFHFNRTDTQHNFSPYFYILLNYHSESWLFKLVTFLPQFLVVFWCGIKYYKTLPFACFMQTFAFVTFNKVCTSQYFIWYIGLIPIAAPFVEMSKKKIASLFSIWIYGQAVWLALAYLYEFRRMNVLFYVWLASVQFFIINLYLLYQFKESYRLPKQKQKEK